MEGSEEAQWEWQAGGGWKAYSGRDNDIIEGAHAAGDEMVELDSGYIVVLAGSAGMRQVKADDPSRSRKVRRTVKPG